MGGEDRCLPKWMTCSCLFCNEPGLSSSFDPVFDGKALFSTTSLFYISEKLVSVDIVLVINFYTKWVFCNF
uniref:Uncharacterized protein n=1 Tax=Cannabis sativa TaxID=3483 RepID=A0A803QTB5_CANSA